MVSKCCVLVCLSALVTFRRTRVGPNDNAFDDDPKDPDYVEEPFEGFEGKFHPPLIILNPDFYKYKI